MSLRSVALILLVISLVSCDRKSLSKTLAINEQSLDTVIDYATVSMYPSFPDCKSLSDKNAQQACFESTITEKLAASLKTVEYKVKQRVHDSSYVHLQVNKDGKTKVVSIDSPETIQQNLPKLDSIIKASVDKLPYVDPAYKLGIPVNSQYKLAVVIQTID